jgi:hypothetical protein
MIGPDLPTALDDAQKRLQTEVIPGQIDIEGKTMTDDPPAVKRTRNPSYVVLRRTEEGDWEGVSDGVAAGRKQAIEVATVGLAQDMKSGTFAVVPVEQFKVIPRKMRVEEISEFG